MWMRGKVAVTLAKLKITKYNKTQHQEVWPESLIYLPGGSSASSQKSYVKAKLSTAFCFRPASCPEYSCDNCVCNICFCPSIVKPRILPSIWLVKTVFSKTDLMHAYHLFSLTEDITKTDIVTPFGLYEFSRTPFGLRNAPQTFQRLIDDVCCDLDFAFVQTWKSRRGLFKPYY